MNQTIALHKHNTDDSKAAKTALEPLGLSKTDYAWPLMFMLSMTMIGQNFPLGYLFVPLILFNRFQRDRYDFIIQLTIFFGCYALTNIAHDYVINIHNIILILCASAIFLLRKPPIIKRAIWLFAAYIVVLLAFAMMSDEALSIQFLGMENWLMIAYMFVPFLVFSGREFDIKVFFRHLFPYLFISCAYYVIDSAILGGMFFLPRDVSYAVYDIFPTFYDPWINPISNAFCRRWPTGLYYLCVLVYPIARYYKLNWRQWALILLALAISRTFLFTIGLVITYILCKGFTFRRLAGYFTIGLTAFVALYFIDSSLGTAYIENEFGEKTETSTFRISSQVDQIINFDPTSADDEALAAIGTGRGAQIIPKFELLYRMGREWIGFGFLSRDLTKNSKYIIDNDLYSNPDMAEEVAIGVESVPFQIVLNIGYIGLILHIVFFALLWVIIKHLKYSGLYAATAFTFAITGFSGISGLIRHDSLILVGLAWAAVVLNSKRELQGFSLPPVRNKEAVATQQNE